METKEQISNSNINVGAENKAITIIVKANALFNAKYKPINLENVIDEYVSLVDADGLTSPFGANNKDYLTYVYMKYGITWSIVLNTEKGEDKGYNVHLVDVVHDPKSGNPNFFTKEVLKANDKNEIYGEITVNPDLKDKEDSYTIHFYISKGDEKSAILPIDPKLQIRGKL
ncbi:hypothetical protein [Ichthyenterobacterium magnum]|uniref:Uncharacterized protein n=1 Tax=Ichthyenterobacterium magnum TaxID=1230530 RepID=A0A420DMA5_9FLAO|nr:hypothetical protein [Ichthyenterobacterium magnum]RKE95373.1 hypothetical protein BXY80_1560 [Ichthyenterobacterium magnum]